MDVKRETECEPVEMLRAVPLFEGMAPECLAELACQVREQTFEPGETIFRVGDPGDRLFVIHQGRVRIELPSEDGPPVILNVIEPGEFFGELALCDGKSRSASAVAMDRVETLTLDRDDFLEFLRCSHTAAPHIIVVLADRLRQVSEHLAESVFYDTASRLARRLLQLAETEAAGSAGSPEGALPRSVTLGREVTPDELAELVGATAERIRQELDSLEQDRIINTRDNRVTILSLPLLRERVHRKATAGPGSVTIPTWLLE